jgi:glycosyltransferase involved in cell wall biosynthesis
MGSDLRAYRLPFIRRIAQPGQIALALFPTEIRSGSGASSLPVSSPEAVTVTNLKAIYWPRAGLRVAWLRGTGRILRGRFDVIVCPENVHNLSVWIIALLHRVFGSRFVLHGHGKPRRFAQRHWVSMFRNLARRVLLTRADAIITYSDRGRADTVKMGFEPARVFVAQNTLDIDALRTAEQSVSPDDVEAVQASLGLSPGRIILFVGRLQAIKRVDLLIEAFGMEKARGLNCDLVIIGEGPERPRLERLASGRNDVHFLGEIYDEGQLAPYFITADVLAIPGRVGLTCVHGFAHGLPLITTSERLVSQSPEYDYVEDGYNAVTVDELSAAAFGSAMSDLLHDGPRLARLAEGARSTADGLGMDKMVLGFLRAVDYAMRRY